MHWSVEGAADIIALRCHHASGRWNDFVTPGAPRPAAPACALPSDRHRHSEPKLSTPARSSPTKLSCTPFAWAAVKLSAASGRLSPVGRKLLYDRPGADVLIAQQSGLITRGQALACGLTEQAIRSRIRSGGPWQVLIPGVYATFTGDATLAQKEVAALLYAGPSSAITGQAAMAAHGINTLGRTVVDVLIPARYQRRDHGFVHVLRTWRVPKIVYNLRERRYVPPARAVADAARQLRDIRDVRTVVAAAVQWHRVSVAELAAELEQGPTAGSAQFRAALVEVADGIRSSAEADLRKLIKRSGLPDPLYNPAAFRGR